MYKPIANQLNLDERQTHQLKVQLESQSWLYSDSTLKRALACYGYTIGIHLLIALPFLVISLALSSARL